MGADAWPDFGGTPQTANNAAMKLTPACLRQLIARRWLQIRLRERDFSIVSNNCWGAHIYQQLATEYRTPFIGLFLMPDCYLRLLGNLRAYLVRPLRFMPSSRYDSINQHRATLRTPYPIGALDDGIEIHFLHCQNEDEARTKWHRRLARFTPEDDKLFVKFCDHDGCTLEQLRTFDALPLPRKVCFTSRPLPQLATAVWIPETEGGNVPNGLKLSKISHRYFDAADWLAGGSGRPRAWSFLRCI